MLDLAHVYKMAYVEPSLQWRKHLWLVEQTVSYSVARQITWNTCHASPMIGVSECAQAVRQQVIESLKMGL